MYFGHKHVETRPKLSIRTCYFSQVSNALSKETHLFDKEKIERNTHYF